MLNFINFKHKPRKKGKEIGQVHAFQPHCKRDLEVPESVLSGFLPVHPPHPCVLPSLLPTPTYPTFPRGNFSAERLVLRTRIYQQRGPTHGRLCSGPCIPCRANVLPPGHCSLLTMGHKCNLELSALWIFSFPSRIASRGLGNVGFSHFSFWQC